MRHVVAASILRAFRRVVTAAGRQSLDGRQSCWPPMSGPPRHPTCNAHPPQRKKNGGSGSPHAAPSPEPGSRRTIRRARTRRAKGNDRSLTEAKRPLPAGGAASSTPILSFGDTGVHEESCEVRWELSVTAFLAGMNPLRHCRDAAFPDFPLLNGRRFCRRGNPGRTRWHHHACEMYPQGYNSWQSSHRLRRSPLGFGCCETVAQRRSSLTVMTSTTQDDWHHASDRAALPTCDRREIDL